MLLKFCFFILVFVSSLQVSAQELYDYNQTVRALGMGGVHILDSNDHSSMLRNPASLAYQSGVSWNVFGMNTGFTTDSSTITAVQNLGNINGIASLAPLYGKNIYSSLSGDTTLQMPYIGLSLYSDNFMTMLLTNPAFPTLDMTYFSDYALVIGAAVPLGPAGAIGVNLKRIVRTGDQVQLGPASLLSVTQASLLSNFTDVGIAYGFDLGYELKIPAPGNPLVHVMWKDVASTAFNPASGSLSAPPRIKDNLILGVQSFAKFMGFGYSAGLEYRHITDDTTAFGKKIHLGAELNLPLIDVRGGFYQGYSTYGATFDFWIFQVDADVYSVEKGAYPGQNGEQRAQIGISLHMGFDPNFKLTDAGGSRRRLKQRR